MNPHAFDIARCLSCGGALCVDPTLAAWACFRIVDGKAVLTRVELGVRRPGEVEITGGLAAGQVPISYCGGYSTPVR